MDETPTAVLEPSSVSAEPVRADDSAATGTRLGRYLVIEELGRGGMGQVLRAYDPKLQRELALKRLRVGSLGASADARLVREARAMARLSHPNVVAVYDVETGERDNDVVVAMEYVPGTTLRAWLKAESREWRAIVAAHIAAGRGLAAAHAVGLMHRDFKLDNVLVGTDGRVRVTDFGLARAAGSQSSASSVDLHAVTDDEATDDGVSVELTEAGMVMGTPPYMAPEQMDDADVDARADQYAFCVSLWRALTDAWPFEGRGRALLAAKRAGPPRWPTDVAVPRHIVEALRRGLAPRPDDRWPDMTALLAELARDPSRRRHRVFALAGLAIAGLGAFMVQRVLHARERAACEQEGRLIEAVWHDTRAAAIAAAFDATELSYAGDAWSRAHPRMQAWADAWQTARTQTCEAVEIDGTLPVALGRAARGCLDEQRDALNAMLGQFERADRDVVLKAAIVSASLPRVDVCKDEEALRQRAEPPDPVVHDRVVTLRSRLADCHAANAMGRSGEALEGAQAVLDEATALGWAPLVAEAQMAVGRGLDGLARYEQARDAYQAAFFGAGAAGRDELAMKASAALVFTVGERLARVDDGLQWGRLGEMLAQRLGREDELPVTPLLVGIGSVHGHRGDHTQAFAYLERSLAISERILGPDHPDIATTLNNIAAVAIEAGELDRATELFERAVVIQENTIGSDHPLFASTLANLGICQAQRGQLTEAMESFERALAIQQTALGPDHPNVAVTLTHIATGEHHRSEHAKALALYRRALAILERAFGPDHPQVAGALVGMGTEHLDLEMYDEALAIDRRALAIYEKKLPDHPHMALTLVNIGAIELRMGRHAQALATEKRALAIQQERLGPDHPSLAITCTLLGEIHTARKDVAQAVEWFERALAIRERAKAPAADLASSRFALAVALWDAGSNRTRAVELAKAAAEGQRSAGEDTAEALGRTEAWLASHR